MTAQVYSCPSSVGPGELVNVQVRLMFSGDDNDGPWQVTHISLRDDDIWPVYNTIANVNTPFQISSQGTWYYYTFNNVRLSDWNDGGDGIEVYVETEVDDNDFNGYNPSGSSAIYQVAVCSVSTPSTPSGPSSGIVGNTLSFSTSGSTCAAGHSVQYRYDWGDGNISAWGSSSQSHAYTSASTYTVKAQARCATRTSVVSSWSSGKSVTVNLHTVSTPSTPSGPSSGVTGTSLAFSTGGSTCTAGHSVQYRFNWGDGTTSSWGASSQSKTYSSAGNYSVTAQARCATDNTILSSSSSGKSVAITAHAVSTPTTPSGPSSGVTGVSLSYSTGSSSCNAGHSVEYRFSWGDGTTSAWGSSSQSKTYSSAGNYSITAQARCVTDNSILSGSSSAKSVSIAIHTVSTPSTPSGPTKGSTGVQLDFNTGASSCNAGHSVQYRYEWGDGVTSAWGSSAQSHTYGSPATYTLRTQARCATDTTVLSSFSASSSVMVAGNTSAGPDRGNTTAQEYGDALYDNFSLLGYNYNHAGLSAGIDSSGVARIFESSASDEPADPNNTPSMGPQEGRLYESFLIEGANYYGAYIPSTYAGTMPFADRRAIVSKAKEAVDDAGISYPIVTVNAINYDSVWTPPLDPNELTDLRCDGLVEYAFERSGIRVWRNCLEADSEWNIAYYPAHHNNNPGNTRDPHFEMSPWAQRGAPPATGPIVLGNQYSGPPWPDTKMTKVSPITLPTCQIIVLSTTTDYVDLQVRSTDESGIYQVTHTKPDGDGPQLYKVNPERHPTSGTWTTPTIRYIRLPGNNYYPVRVAPQDHGGNWGNVVGADVYFLPYKATSPVPSHGSTDRPISQTLSWANGGGATSYDVYFGTDSTPDSTELVGNQTTPSYNPGTLANGTTYYWRIDSKNSAGTTTGDVWSFTTATAPTRVISLSGDLAFGNVTVGSSSQRTLNIANTGNSTLTVNSISYPSGFSGNWSGTIVAGGSQNVPVTFSPSSATSYSGNLTVNSDATSGTATRAVSGTGIATPTRVISLSGDLAFGDVTVASSSQRTLTIANTGNSVLTVSGISYPGGFSGNWSGLIAAGGSQNVPVTFSPTSATSYSGNLTVNSDATSGTSTRAVSGTGVAAPTRVIALSGDMAFGNVVTNTTATRTLTIANSGNSTLSVSGINYPAGFAGNWFGTIVSGGSQNVTVTFSPIAVTSYIGNLTVNSDATSGTSTHAISGTGIDVTPKQLTGMVMSNGVARFYLNGPVGSNYLIQVSTNLVNWQPMSAHVIPAGGSVMVTDLNPVNQSRRFYRAIPYVAQVVLLYDPVGDPSTGLVDSALPLPPTSYIAGIQASNLILVGASPVVGWKDYTSYNWPTTTSVNLGKYISFSFSISPGKAAYFSRLEFSYRTSSGNARAAALRSSIDGFAANLGTLNPLASGANAFDLSTPVPTSGTVEFRLYLYDAPEWSYNAWIISSGRPEEGGFGFRLIGTVMGQ